MVVGVRGRDGDLLAGYVGRDLPTLWFVGDDDIGDVLSRIADLDGRFELETHVVSFQRHGGVVGVDGRSAERRRDAPLPAYAQRGDREVA